MRNQTCHEPNIWGKKLTWSIGSWGKSVNLESFRFRVFIVPIIISLDYGILLVDHC